jgi:DNA repair protein RecN (Recombination protein N)
MLQLLRIRNFVIIDSLEIEFQKGLNVITGETGAGKSILLDAIALVLGSRANLDVIRNGSDEATVEALFDISSQGKLLNTLNEFEIPTENELLIKRTIHRSGKNKIFINGEMVTLSQLGAICENLIELCSQHEHQSLTKSDFQLELLDRYGGFESIKEKVKSDFLQLNEIRLELEKVNGASIDARTEDYLRFQVQEIRNFEPKENEEDELMAERKKLLNATNLSDSVGSALGLLDQGDMDVKTLIGKSLQRLHKAYEMDNALKAPIESLESAKIQIDEASFFLNDYLSNIEMNPSRLDQVEERLAKWSMMKKKYGADASAILKRAEEIESELSLFENRIERVKKLESEYEKAKDIYQQSAQGLSKKRKNTSKTLCATIKKELADLSMPGTEFIVDFQMSEPKADGSDKVQFLFSPNPGEEAKPISKVASGGELSRIMLAIRRSIADKGTIGVYLFDEVDAGIGGHTGTVVGAKLKSVSEYNQVLCITHLPQVAAFADAHFHVSKKTNAGRTVSEVDLLSGKERVEEIARMLGGVKVTEKSRAHAKSLLEEAH